LLKGKDGRIIPAYEIELGTPLSHGVVVGIIQKETSSYCKLKNECVAPGTMVWCDTDHLWKRAGDMATPIPFQTPIPYYSFVVSPSATLETVGGLLFRDYVEVHSPDMEGAYTEALTKEGYTEALPNEL
jgi:hypothetical protein